MNIRGGDNIRARLFKYLGIVKAPPEVNQNTQNLSSQVASIHTYSAPNANEIIPAPPEIAKKQTPYPSPQLTSSSDEDYLTPRSQDSSENISRSSSPGVSLAEIALAMEVNGQKNNGELVQKYFIPKNLGIKNR
jgi:hypothetical protein